MKIRYKYISSVLIAMFLMVPYVMKAQTCDYTSSSVTFNIGTPGTLPANSLTSYLLVDHATGAIVQISSTPTFTGIVQSKTYDAYAFSYVNDGTVTGLTVGGNISAVTAACSSLSAPLTVNICPTGTPTSCDYTTSTITVHTSTSPPASPAVTSYVLTNTSGTILQISSTTTFTGLSGSQSYNVYAVSYTGTSINSSLVVGGNINTVAVTTPDCLSISSPLSIGVCVCQPICLPVTLTRVK